MPPPLSRYAAALPWATQPDPILSELAESEPDPDAEPDADPDAPRISYIRELAPPSGVQSVESRLSPESAARRLVEALVARGVDTFFGIPGGPICPLFEAIRLTLGARLIESRHESHAAFAAALYYRASGKTPAVVVTAGPGVTNVVSGVASASLERAPLLLIAGDVAWAATGQRMAQDSGPEGIAIEELLRPVTRAQVRAAHARSVVSQAFAALDAAQNPLHPGPVLFVLPLDRGMAECVAYDVTPRAEALTVRPPRDAVARTAELLARARRPLLVLGGGCRRRESAIKRLVDALEVPFVTTPRAKGIVSERHSRSLRNGGMAASMWARKYTAEPVDVCIALGTDLDDTSMGPTRYLGPGGSLIHVDLDAGVFGRNLPTTIGVAADVGAFADALFDEVNGWLPATPCARAAIRDAHTESPFDVPDAARDASLQVRPHRLIKDLEAAVKCDARFVTDIGEHMLFGLHYLTITEPDAFHIQLNLGSMASGIAGAIGLAVADRKRLVVCIAGDGGMQMAGMEALVALRERLPILFVVFNDGRYNMVHHGMKQIFGAADQYDTPPIDFSAWSAAFGMPAVVVSKPGQLNRTLVNELLASGGPALIDARVDSSVRIRGGGRVEALQHMSMLSQAGERR
jgi:acetolactate synthase I/II/III large subunit